MTEIEGQKASRLRGERRGFCPVYSFNLDDQLYTVRPREPSRTNRWKVGDEAELHAAPDNPDCFRVGNQISDLVYAGAALVLGALLLDVRSASDAFSRAAHSRN